MNCTQKIKIGSRSSDLTNNIKGIPHISILSLLFFKIYISGLLFFPAKCEICYFPDDNSLYSCHINLDTIFTDPLKDMNGLYAIY